MKDHIGVGSWILRTLEGMNAATRLMLQKKATSHSSWRNLFEVGLVSLWGLAQLQFQWLRRLIESFFLKNACKRLKNLQNDEGELPSQQQSGKWRMLQRKSEEKSVQIEKKNCHCHFPGDKDRSMWVSMNRCRLQVLYSGFKDNLI